jgi:hypothetical protein
VPSFVDVPWLSENPASGTLAPNGVQPIQLTVDTTGLTPGVYHATLFIQTNSGRVPTLQVAVSLIVPAYYQAVNAGDGAYIDHEGDTWATDQLYSVGSWGFTSSASKVVSTPHAISGTEDDPLYQFQRESPLEYRFDGLPAGVYEVDLRFAEVKKQKPNKRVFDIIIEGSLVIPALDVAAEVGSFAADQHTLFLPVTDGQLNIRFVDRRTGDPIVNAIRIRHRPDR